MNNYGIITELFIDGVIGRCDICVRPRKYPTKAGSRLFRVRNRIHIFHQPFCARNVHTDTCQCIVLSRRTFSG